MEGGDGDGLCVQRSLVRDRGHDQGRDLVRDPVLDHGHDQVRDQGPRSLGSGPWFRAEARSWPGPPLEGPVLQLESENQRRTSTAQNQARDNFINNLAILETDQATLDQEEALLASGSSQDARLVEVQQELRAAKQVLYIYIYGRSGGRSVSRAVGRSVGRSAGWSVAQSVGRPVGRSVGWSVGRSARRSIVW